jgi:hypothetical protein
MVAAFQRIAQCPATVATVAMTGVLPTDSSTSALLDIACNLR